MSTEDKKGISKNSLPAGGAGGMEYNFRDIEKKWQQHWKETKAYKVNNDFSKPKYYVLDMFPYPSGAGLHVGHPLGYIASDIYSRYKRLKGFNVLHPMGFDSFGLPAEQYALDTGQHPAVTTKKNIETFKKQLDNIGFCYDWSREVQTSDPKFYKWTQWIFLQLFNSFYNRNTNKAESIQNLIAAFEKEGNVKYSMPNAQYSILNFTAKHWNGFDEKTKQEILMQYRLAFCGYGEVNWCEALGTVLANDEVVNGVSERGGHPVVKKKLRQWYLRITEYADRLLQGLDTVDFSDAMKEMQSNWIGKSSGAEIDFRIKIGETEEISKETTTEIVNIDGKEVEVTNITITERVTENDESLRVYTTRPDTIFGVDFMVIAPEHELVEEITTAAQKQAVDEYITYVKSRSERERMAEKKITGVFTGAYAKNLFNGREIPIWISEYVLAGYGTGAIMAVPCGDERDLKFAKHFNIPVTNIIGKHFNGEEANPTKDAILENSGFLDGMVMRDAIEAAINKIEEIGIGKRKVNYKMRDAAFSRQRYWGEPFPIVWKNARLNDSFGQGIAYPLDEKELPLTLPEVKKYSPGPDGEGPLANIPDWVNQFGSQSPSPTGEGRGEAKHGALETNTMPGYAGSSWYFLRYMDPHNNETFCDRKVSDYWNQVDLYIGGTEHAVGHLLYSRMWTKVLFDLNLIGFDEPYKKLVNQGMITGKSYFCDWVRYTQNNSDIVFHLFVRRGLSEILGDEEVLNGEKYLKFHAEGVANSGEHRMKNVHTYVDVKGRLTENQYQLYRENEKWSETSRVIWEEEVVNGKSEYILTEQGEKYIQLEEVIEKMSKSKFNVDNPDDIISKYGADTFRMYEMFLGPVEMSKPWDTKGIEGVHRFLKKFWRLFIDETKGVIVTDDEPTAEELKVLHNTIKKIESDTERFSFNTGVSGFMIATNELTDLKCHKRKILEPLLILMAPYAPHITAELYNLLGSEASPLWGGLEGAATYPAFEAKYVAETSKEYPISVNGKLRTTMNIALDAAQPAIEAMVLENDIVQKWLEGKAPKKIIFVKGKMVNVVV
jgi:leucyl-tRNA synthetase